MPQPIQSARLLLVDRFSMREIVDAVNQKNKISP